MAKVLAFDLGASSGKAVLAEYDGKRIKTNEIHRFPNDPVYVNGVLYWDILRLFFEIKKGISKAVNAGGFDTLAIDTWGVDFGLVGYDGQLLENPVHYRDSRTDDFSRLYETLPKEKIYASTGIQEMPFNTLFQLAYLYRERPDLMARTKKMLFIPDLLNYFLTGEMKAEYTIASTSAMLNASERTWDLDLIKTAGIDPDILCDIIHPGEVCGRLSAEICSELGAPPARVMCAASHDTASAVAAVPASEEDFIYVISGTWSLFGAELKTPRINEKASLFNFTNEGGANKTIRYLKNIMGTWLIQECKRQWEREGKVFSFGELDEMAGACRPFQSLIDVDAPEFLKPGDMPERIRAYCRETGQHEPAGEGEIVRCVYESLAMKYRRAMEMIEESAPQAGGSTGSPIGRLGGDSRSSEAEFTNGNASGTTSGAVHILGGGVQSSLLCSMTASAMGRTVYAGPTEATALGNIAVQLIAAGEIGDIKEARRVIKESSELLIFEAVDREKWDEQCRLTLRDGRMAYT
ncbi:MAG: rhamnulokinase [Clostridiales Family XIII bacterium]|jgi:rhamnulokinase/L-fuculokinase|nr:rhamnulokinase [Clostridiales Family XIII bacterium]